MEILAIVSKVDARWSADIADCGFQKREAEASKVLVEPDIDVTGICEVKPRDTFQGGSLHMDAAAKVIGRRTEDSGIK